MKVLFLDIDGVLNHDNTVERIPGMGNYTGLDKELVERYQNWIRDKNYVVVLSSDWRRLDLTRRFLLDSGIHFSFTTPIFNRFRGDEVSDWLNRNSDVKSYAILDDVNQFNDSQQDNLVLTNPGTGVTDFDLKQVDKILRSNEQRDI